MHQIQQVRARITLDVEFDPSGEWREHIRNVVHVGGSDVPRVRSRVNGDAGSARLDTHPDRLKHRWNTAAA